jgi:hypothetical protein
MWAYGSTGDSLTEVRLRSILRPARCHRSLGSFEMSTGITDDESCGSEAGRLPRHPHRSVVYIDPGQHRYLREMEASALRDASRVSASTILRIALDDFRRRYPDWPAAAAMLDNRRRPPGPAAEASPPARRPSPGEDPG